MELLELWRNRLTGAMLVPMRRLLSLAMVLLLGVGCTASRRYITIGKTMRLRVGMSVEEVQKLLGEPIRKIAAGRRAVWKYRVHSLLGGWNPVYVVFGESVVLERWFQREEEYREQMKLWGELIP